MIGIFLVTHGTLGESLIQNVCHVLNKRPPLIAQLGVAAQDDPLDILPLARLLLKEVDGGEGVLVMTDVFGATPGNLALKLLEPGRVEGVSGVSLPMLLRALTYRERGMETMLQKAVSGARDGVVRLPPVLGSGAGES
ncbi:PTS fructose transporter subunit IIA [Accumulibacter sp.]|jgi:PTS system mannose-specific IIA component|uniref:PTS sugar transporter subunit IIA n=1 Tax=Accumulibacter sp. TaxID=2053492 RepID=UPI001AC6E77B|nr:PTS fructose transporter subunit IIA [Accumulibacter sp.]MBN8453295.1 PTS fructose transporter subunit IIA [Accumulibacter sp.]MBO3705986.1 PTS fructose transporter subunit IIA [Candidatus Accumulibacter conexus]